MGIDWPFWGHLLAIERGLATSKELIITSLNQHISVAHTNQAQASSIAVYGLHFKGKASDLC
jgi:hypothetical protein